MSYCDKRECRRGSGDAALTEHSDPREGYAESKLAPKEASHSCTHAVSDAQLTVHSNVATKPTNAKFAVPK